MFLNICAVNTKGKYILKTNCFNYFLYKSLKNENIFSPIKTENGFCSFPGFASLLPGTSP